MPAPDNNKDAGPCPTFDAGPTPPPSDAGFTCTPASVFCEGALAWQCTYTGHDALVVTDCTSGGRVDGGYCVPRGGCPPGKVDQQGGTYECCDP